MESVKLSEAEQIKKAEEAMDVLLALIRNNPRLKSHVASYFSFLSKPTIPYRNKREAERVRPIIDAMIESGKDIEFQYASYAGLYTATTIRTMIFNTILWLVEDSGEEKYANWRKGIEIVTRPTGILVKYKKPETQELLPKDQLAVAQGGQFIASFVDLKQDTATWREELYKFIETSKEGETFSLKELSLTADYINEINTLLTGLGDKFVGAVTVSQIKVIHLKNNEEVNEE